MVSGASADSGLELFERKFLFLRTTSWHPLHCCLLLFQPAQVVEYFRARLFGPQRVGVVGVSSRQHPHHRLVPLELTLVLDTIQEIIAVRLLSVIHRGAASILRGSGFTMGCPTRGD